MKLESKKTFKEIYSVILKDLGAYGGFPFYGLLILLFLLLRDFSFAYTLIISLVVVTIVVIVFRLTYFKPRPGQKKKKHEILYQRVDNSSFPSIHAARAVMLSFALFAKAPVLLPLLVLLTLIVFASRLHFKRHDTADVVVGLLIGGVLGLIFF